MSVRGCERVGKQDVAYSWGRQKSQGSSLGRGRKTLLQPQDRSLGLI